MTYVAFLIRWYVVNCFFNVFCVFLGKYSPQGNTLFVSSCMEVALHICCMSSNNFCMMLSI